MSRDIFYIGSSVNGLQSILDSGLFCVRKVFCLKSRATKQLQDTVQKWNLTIEYFNWIKDFRLLIKKHPKDIPFFIYQLDMLVPADIVNEYCFFNVHRGSLYTNRGPNPDVWPILLGHTHTYLSLHRINEKIDSGLLIASYEVSILEIDDTTSVRKKLEKGLPYVISKLHNYLNGKIQATPLRDGTYHPWITEKDFTIDPCKDSIKQINRKIRSQRQYNGAILWVDDKKFYVTEISKKINNKGPCGIACVDGDIIKVFHDDNLLYLRLNKTPKCPPPPIFPKSRRI